MPAAQKFHWLRYSNGRGRGASNQENKKWKYDRYEKTFSGGMNLNYIDLYFAQVKAMSISIGNISIFLQCNEETALGVEPKD